MPRTGRPKSPKTETDKLIAYNIGRAREACGFTQPAAAAALGIPMSTMQKHEQGQTQLKADLLRFYAHAYGLTVDALYTPLDQPLPKPQNPTIPPRPIFTLVIAPDAKLSKALRDRAAEVVAALNAEAAGLRRP